MTKATTKKSSGAKAKEKAAAAAAAEEKQQQVHEVAPLESSDILSSFFFDWSATSEQVHHFYRTLESDHESRLQTYSLEQLEYEKKVFFSPTIVKNPCFSSGPASLPDPALVLVVAKTKMKLLFLSFSWRHTGS